MAELVDARDLKSLGALPRAGSSPAPGTSNYEGLADSWPVFFLWELWTVPVIVPVCDCS
jgi:hypothetical protein